MLSMQYPMWASHLHRLLYEVAPVLCIANMAHHPRHLEPLGPQVLHCVIYIVLTSAATHMKLQACACSCRVTACTSANLALMVTLSRS
jgi:hypothetical protein